MWAGPFLLLGEVLVVSSLSTLGEPDFYRQFVETFVQGCICLIPGGIVLGAVTGQICGTIYAFSDDFLLRVLRGLPTIELQPIAEADIDVLLAWVCGPKLCRRWAGDQLTFPLDRSQLLARFATSSGDRPERRIFKAVDVSSGHMVGYVEIGWIHDLFRHARLELPLVDPMASERGRLGVLLLQKAAETAFRELGTLGISVVSHSEHSELALCCRRAWTPAWTMDYGFYSYWNQVDAMWIGRLRGKEQK